MKLLTTFFLCTLVNTAFACSCGQYLIDLPVKEMGWTQTETERISSFSELIFSGILIDGYPVEETYLTDHFTEAKALRLELVFKLLKSYQGTKRDTIKIRTNQGSSSCGFEAKLNTECLIFATKGNNSYYYTYRSDCCKSISKEADEKRYNKYIKFLESLTNMIDGEYLFTQTKNYWSSGRNPDPDTLEAARYTIKNGKLDGLWKLTDRLGRVLEKGMYKNGQKIGTWEVVSYTDSDIKGASQQIRIEKITYKNGIPHKNVQTIEDKVYIWEEGVYKPVKTLRKQKMIKKYTYWGGEK